MLGLLLLAAAAPEPAPLAVGVAAEDRTGVAAFSRSAGVRPAIEVWYAAWAGEPGFDPARADAAAADGALPMLTWEPWDPAAGAVQPDYTPGRIAAGAHDAYIASFARQVRDWGGTLALRLMHEADAPHYPWSVGVGGTTAADLVAAWRHVHDVFRDQGADVVWVWCVNVHSVGTAAYGPLYPGDDVVDWLAVDGYNGGDALPWGGWRSPAEVFADSLADLRALSGHPIVITETASAEEGGDKADWIRRLFALAEQERVRGLIWFEADKEADWRISSSPESAAAFREQAAVSAEPPLPARFSGEGAGWRPR
ncbi:hypothetical protein GCM10010472_31350 [Pseudonocardia halophobica]|uniref:GH26 domain-containing protein n=1 Tax=Pseudonocardia halophobica TaxID=29401 RepID=A0A9W6L192_9PSEU|nr:glycosyl hydrolase [Pseudonocardia halophobica]GLL10384.1 hypothetical protein GCM10017577_15240 [Pseudonocardia halophobica]